MLQVRFEVFTAVTKKNAVYWDVAPYRSCVKGRFGGMYRLHLQGIKIRERGTSLSRFTQDLHGATSQTAAFFILQLSSHFRFVVRKAIRNYSWGMWQLHLPSANNRELQLPRLQLWLKSGSMFRLWLRADRMCSGGDRRCAKGKWAR
jgi:hypothetical protein